MEIKINISDEERMACLEAITALNKIEHLKWMSQAVIAETCGVKATKVRAVLQDLVDNKLVGCYVVADNPRLKRYYYVVTDAGKQLVSPQPVILNQPDA